MHFKYRRSGEKKWRVCKLELFEFMRRYLQHVLPHGFTKVRHYGFMSANAKVPLQKIRELICRLYEVIKEMLPEVPPPRKKPWICRNCGGTIRWRALERSGKIISEGNSEAVHLFHALGALDKKKTHPLHHKSRLVLHETTVFVLKTEPNPYVEIS